MLGPSLMCADMGNLETTIKKLDCGRVDFFHFDIMDGDFVPNFTMGPDMIKALRSHTNILFDIHLMINQPERYIDLFTDSGADMISVHAEATNHLQRTLKSIQNKGLKAGVALNPSTPLSVLDYVWDTIDYVVIMTVNPGFSGQEFIPLTLGKIAELKEIIVQKEMNIKIQVDGNISYKTIPDVLTNGADMLVCGTSCLFRKDKSIDKALRELHDFLNNINERV